MRITVQRGVAVQLDAYRTTSVHGGVYDISDLSPEDRARVLATSGVSRVKGKAPGKGD